METCDGKAAATDGRHRATARNSRLPPAPERPARAHDRPPADVALQSAPSRCGSTAGRACLLLLLARPNSARRSPNDPENPKIAAPPSRTRNASTRRPSASPAPKRPARKPKRGVDRLRRILDPFDVMRSTRALAPHDPKLNDIRWLIGEALRRRLSARPARQSARRRSRRRSASAGFGPRAGLPSSEIALHARDKLRAARRAGRPRRLADRHAHRHRRRGGARLPRFHPRSRHPLARRRRRHRPAAGRARHDRRADGGDGVGKVRASTIPRPQSIHT